LQVTVTALRRRENSIPLPEPSAEYRIKKLIICLFANNNSFDRTGDESSTKVDVYYFSPTCTKPLVAHRLF